MKKACFASMVIFLIMVAGSVFAAPPVEWEKTFGGSAAEFSTCVQQTIDGGYIVTGNTRSYGAGNYDVYLIKTDAAGDEVWSKTFGGTEWDGGGSVKQTSDGGYIIAGNTVSYGAGSRDVYLIKTDPVGDEIWSATFGGAEWDFASSVQQTTDGGYIIVGNTESYGAGSNDVYLIKTDAAGNEVWSKTFGGSDGDNGISVLPTADGGYMIAGVTQSYGTGSYDVYLIKADSAGDDVWSKTIGGSSDYAGFSMQQTADGGYVITGMIGSWEVQPELNVYLLKTDAEGNQLWSKTFGGPDRDYGTSVHVTVDGGYIISGLTESYGAGDSDAYLIKTDANGDEIWSGTYGGIALEDGISVKQTADGGYIMAGQTTSYGSGLSDIYLVKTAPDAPVCNADLDHDGDADGDDLAVFTADFGRTDCPCR